MKTIIIITTLFIYNLGIAQIVNIPDSNFKFTLVNVPCVDTDGNGYVDSEVDTNNDGEIQVTEAEAVDNLLFGSHNIQSLEGIQSFINLRKFHFSNNPIESVDLSQNQLLEFLVFTNVPISSIDLSQNTNLLEFGFGSTAITEIDVSQNLQLVFLDCAFNSLLSNVNISQNIGLKKLYSDNTIISEIDISNNINLEEVLIYNNMLTSLDVSNNPNIEWLDFANNQISNIDLSQNINLQRIDFKNNLLTSLDISENPNIFRIHCENNQLTSLKLKNGNSNAIVRLITFGNPDLSCIQVDDVAYANNQVCEGYYEDGNWCKDETAIYSEDCNLGIGDVVLSEVINLYPNPVKNTLQISTGNNLTIKNIAIFDVLGKKVLATKSTPQIDVSTLATGLLFVKIKTDKGVVVKKVVKE